MLELRSVGWVGADSVPEGVGEGEGTPGGGNSAGGESDGEGLTGMGLQQRKQTGWRGGQGRPWAGQDTLRSASCRDARCPGCSGQDRMGKGRRGRQEAAAASR